MRPGYFLPGLTTSFLIFSSFAAPAATVTVAPSFTITTVAGTGAVGYSGSGGPATSAKLDDPRGIVTDPSGNVYF